MRKEKLYRMHWVGYNLEISDNELSLISIKRDQYLHRENVRVPVVLRISKGIMLHEINVSQ